MASVIESHVDQSYPGREPRTAMFVAATLRFGVTLIPVRIRNMSPGGALVEAQSLPPRGTEIELTRVQHVARGKMAWVKDNRGGLALEGPVPVALWMSSKVPTHQQQVDALLAEARAAIAAAPLEEPGAEPTPGFEVLRRSASEELDLIGLRLGALGDVLIDDAELVERHGEALQAIDETQQRLAAVSRRLRQ